MRGGEQGSGHEQEPPWYEKVVRLHDVLTERDIPYAFGGAIAMNYHREPRATYDVDVDKVSKDLRSEGQSRSRWGYTYVDLFFANTEFHDSMARRAERQPFENREIMVLSIEDLLVCKVVYDRPKDWIDIAAVAESEGERLDRNYMGSVLQYFFDSDDPRIERLWRTIDNS